MLGRARRGLSGIALGALVMFTVLGASGTAAAQATGEPVAVPVITPAAGPVQGPAVDPVGNPWGLLAGLVFLLLLAAAAWWLVRRMGGLNGAVAGADMRILASLPLGPRERVVIAQIGSEQWALGVAPGRVSLLHRFPEPIVQPGRGDRDDFSRRMRQLLQQGLGR